MAFFEINAPNGKVKIGNGQPAFIIAELSANHEQKFEKAVEMIKTAAAIGANAIKIQTYTPDTLTINCDKEWFVVGKGAGGAENPEQWKGKNLYELYKNANTPYEWHSKLKKITEDLGMVFFSTPYEETAVDFLETLNVPLYKVASYEVTHIPFLKRLAKTNKPVIMSVGFSTLEEIQLAVNTLRENGCKDIALLHCTTAYSKEPKPEHANLKTMLDLKQRFGVVTGFSDNNAGVEIPLQAMLMGASIIEKHFVLPNEDAQGLDEVFSIGPKEFKEFVDAVRRAEKAIGEVKYGVKCEAERKNSLFQRSIFIVKNIKKGEKFTVQNVRVIRPRFGIEPKYYEEILGRFAAKDIEFGTPLTWGLIEKLNT